VNAVLPLLETSSSSTGKTILPQEIVDMPINGRNYLDLLQLVPGVAINRQADAIDKEVDDILLKVRGRTGPEANDVDDKKFHPSIQDRVNQVAAEIGDVTSPPTQIQRETLQLAMTDLVREAARLNVLLTTKVPALNRALDAAGDHHGPGLAADFLPGEHVVMEMIDQDLRLLADGMMMAFDVTPELLLRLFDVALGIVLEEADHLEEVVARDGDHLVTRTHAESGQGQVQPEAANDEDSRLADDGQQAEQQGGSKQLAPGGPAGGTADRALMAQISTAMKAASLRARRKVVRRLGRQQCRRVRRYITPALVPEQNQTQCADDQNQERRREGIGLKLFAPCEPCICGTLCLRRNFFSRSNPCIVERLPR